MSEKYKAYKRKLRWKSSIRKEGAHGLVPCPHCGGDIQHDPRGGYRCQGCGEDWGDTEQERARILPNTPCPSCGQRMYFRGGASLGGMWPDGAWECESGDYSHMRRPEDLVPDTYQDPDASSSGLTVPQGWGTDDKWGNYDWRELDQ